MIANFITRMPIYWKNIVVVMVGTVIAQAIPVLTLPIVSRFIISDDLGLYFNWFSIGLICTVFVVCALDLAIYTAKSKNEIDNIIQTVTQLALAFILFACIVAAATALTGVKFLKMGPIQIATIGVFAGLSALAQCILATFVYNGRFVEQAIAKFINAAIPAVCQLLVLVVGDQYMHLVFAQMSGMIIAFYCILRMNGISSLGDYRIITKFNSIWSSLARLKRFPIYALPANFFGTLSTQSPLLAIGFIHGSETAAHYGIAMKTIAIPIGLLAGSIQTVFKNEASEEYRKNKNCHISYKKTARNLLFIAITVAVLVYFSVDTVFTILYGLDYIQSSIFIKILLPSIVIGIIASPLSFTLYLSQRQNWDLIWQILLFSVTFLIFYNLKDIYISLYFYSGAYFTLYVVYMIMSWRAAKE
jgi:O-antigen/teichoic acid export membrane protein